MSLLPLIRKFWRSLFFFLISVLLALYTPVALSSPSTTHIFFSAGCADCWPYVQEIILPTLQAQGLATESRIHDYTIPSEREKLLEISDSIKLPRSLADSLYIFVPTQQGTLAILGHVPPALVTEAVTSPETPSRLVIWQPKMHGTPTEYRLWAWAGEVQSFPIDTPYATALEQTIAANGALPADVSNLAGLLPVVVATALLDSINPCAFAVILLLIAFLFTLRKSRDRILQLGGIYIFTIFAVYLAIGLGFLRTVRLSDNPHFVALLGSWLLIILGIFNLIEYRWPNFPLKLHMPAFAHAKTNQLIKQATVPATLAMGLLVGLCTFPCSGGIYVSIITLLNAKTTLGWGISYLILYNILFVLPLIIILLAVGNRMTAKAWATWERKHSLLLRLWYGIVMVALGFGMWQWII